MQTTKPKGGKGGKIAALASSLIVLIALFFMGDEIADSLKPKTTGDFSYTSGTVAVHFIDVGQGASTLIQSGDDGILIDAGERDYADRVIEYIHDCGVTKLSYVIASHPHSDHIGAMADVLNAVPAENIIMPFLTKENTPTNVTYERLLKAIQTKQINTIMAEYGKTYSIENASIEILGPLVQDSDLNNMSVVCKLTAFSTRFMLLADADRQEQYTIMNKGADLRSEIVLMGHHGSSKALNKTFLKKVAPSVAVISCGANNDYGHPHKETREYLQKNKIEDYRTDLQSHIVFVCDSRGYRIQTAA